MPKRKKIDHGVTTEVPEKRPYLSKFGYATICAFNFNRSMEGHVELLNHRFSPFFSLPFINLLFEHFISTKC